MSDLVEVTFQPEGRTAWVRAGATLVEAGEAAGVEIVMGCTRGMCGTDPVRIASGADGLSAPEPHETGTIERMGLGPDHRLLIPAGFLGGAIFLILADLVSRTLLSPNELPVGVVTALVGGPFFLYLLRTRGAGRVFD